MKLDAVAERTGDTYTIYLMDSADTHNARWHFTGVHDPVTPAEQEEIGWAADQLWADRRATITTVRQAIRACRHTPKPKPTLPPPRAFK